MRLYILSLVFVLTLTACNDQPIKDPQRFTKMTIYNEMPQANRDWGGGVPVVVEEKGVILDFIEQVNKSERQDLSDITWEQGPGLRIVLEGGNIKREIKAFVSGNVVTEEYVMDSGIDFDQFLKD